MTSNEVVAAIVDRPQAAGVSYVLVGAFSCNVYGVPRSTRDADLVVQSTAENPPSLCRSFGPRFELDPQMSFESVPGTLRFVVRGAGSPFRVELFMLSEDAHGRERFSRRRPVRSWGREVYFPTPEDVVITKLRWAATGRRSKDREDARNIVATQSSNLDWDYLHRWTDVHGTRGLLEELRRSIPEI